MNLPIRILALTAVVQMGCAGAHTLQLARPLGTGNAELGFDVGTQTVGQFSTTPLDGTRTESLSGLDASLEFGVADRSDLLMRLGSSNELGFKQTLFVSDSGIFSIAAATSARTQVRMEQESVLQLRLVTVQGTGSLLFEARTFDRLHFVLTPKLVVISPPIDVKLTAAMSRTSRAVGGGTGTLVYEFSDSVRLLAELGVFSGSLHTESFVEEDRADWDFVVGMRFFSPRPSRVTELLN